MLRPKQAAAPASARCMMLFWPNCPANPDPQRGGSPDRLAITGRRACHSAVAGGRAGSSPRGPAAVCWVRGGQARAGSGIKTVRTGAASARAAGQQQAGKVEGGALTRSRLRRRPRSQRGLGRQRLSATRACQLPVLLNTTHLRNARGPQSPQHAYHASCRQLFPVVPAVGGTCRGRRCVCVVVVVRVGGWVDGWVGGGGGVCGGGGGVCVCVCGGGGGGGGGAMDGGGGRHMQSGCVALAWRPPQHTLQACVSVTITVAKVVLGACRLCAGCVPGGRTEEEGRARGSHDLVARGVDGQGRPVAPARQHALGPAHACMGGRAAALRQAWPAAETQAGRGQGRSARHGISP